MENLNNRIIKPGIASKVSYVVTNDSNSTLHVIRNTNSFITEPYEGVCPPGDYIIVPEFTGSDFSELKKVPITEIRMIKVGENGKYTIENIPSA